VRLTTAGLRALIVNRAGFVAAARRPVVEGPNYGNPQRAWLQAAIRAYFGAGRSSAELWAVLQSKVERRAASPRRESLAAGARALLEQFLVWEDLEDDIAADAFPPVRDVPLGTHTIAVRRDLIYLDGAGYRVRQLWTDHQLRPTNPRANQMAAAVMVSVDTDLGAGLTTSVEIWGLRHRLRRSFSRNELVPVVGALRRQLDEVAAEVQR